MDAAADAGADAVKLQLFEADRLLGRAAVLAGYQARSGASDPFEMLRACELSVEDMVPVAARARARNLHAIVTVFNVGTVTAVVEPSM